MLRIAILILFMLGIVQAMPSAEQAFFCYIPSAEVSAAFAKAVSSIEYASAQLVSAASETRAWDMFLTQFVDCAKSFPSTT